MKSFKKLLIFVYFGFFLGISGLLSAPANAGPDEEELIGQISMQLNEKWEEVFYDFSDLALKKFCPAEYSLIQDVLLRMYQCNRRVSLADLRSEREEVLDEILHRCSNAPLILGLEYRFNEYLAILTADLLLRIEELLLNPRLEISFESRRNLVETIVEAATRQDYHPAKILDILTSTTADPSEIRMDYLAREPGTKVVEGRSAEPQLPSQSVGGGSAAGGAYAGGGSGPAAGSASSAASDPGAPAGGASAGGASALPVEAASKPVKKGHCRVCRKKVGLLAFTCRCEGEFCAAHRPPEEHSCTFDFKAEGKAKLTQANPVVNGDKLPDRI